MKTIQISLVTVSGVDGPGIIAGVTGILFKNGCNLEDISMTLLDQVFTMMAVVRIHPAKRDKASKELEAFANQRDLTVHWKDLKGLKSKAVSNHLQKYLITAIGRDRTGIVHKVSKTLAEAKINITDLNSKILGSAKQPIYAMMLEADIPMRYSIAKLEAKFARLQKELKIEISLKPVEKLEF